MASQSEPSSFSMRIVSIDYYMSPPIPDLDICYSSFHGGDIEEVPVIRIYGSSLSGQKTCLHIHRVLPYLYVPCSDVLHTPQEGYAYTQLISRHVEKGLKSKSSAGSKRQHVHGCSLVRAKRFYGYHSTEELFVKIYLYHPHEVARAAALLMSGTVLNRSFQPYESHFPYLLQFLVDYNLYGMGLIQLSKVKFRHPLPVNLNSRAVHHISVYNILCRHDAEKFPAESESFQVDLGSEACKDLTVWLSSTIPSSWMWPSVAEHSCSPGQGMHLIRRQSTCELEADTSVDEILNQQYKMYTSLSQARSEVKMVQSLVPIWEEYERTGVEVHEMVASPDPTRPSPETVLRNFTCGLEFDTALLNLCKASQNSSSSPVSQHEAEKFLKSIRSLSDSALEEHSSPGNSHGESMKFLKENKIESSSPQILPFEKGCDAKSSGEMDGCHGLSPTVEKMLFADMLDTSNAKVADFEALGLLRWLASSQAMEDLSTDDELINEATLIPLLPTKAIEKVLEKAHLDYERESQQECQDILDSVESKEPARCSAEYGNSSKNMIPQVDGSSDDPFTPDQVDNSSQIDKKDEVHGAASLHSALKDSGKVCVKHNRNKQLWGSLPLSRKQKVHGESDSLNSDETCSDEARSSTDARSSADKQLDYLTMMVDMDTGCCVSKDGKILTGRSVRDLMRRKRSNQFDLSESGSHVKKKVVKVVSAKDWAGESCPGLVHHCETTQVRSSLTNLSDQRSAVQASDIGAATSRSRPVSEVSKLKPYYNAFPRYGKLPLPSCPENKWEDDVFFKHFGFQVNPKDAERHGNSAKSEDIVEPSQLAVQSIQVPECSIRNQRCWTENSSNVEFFEAKKLSDSTCFKPLEHDVRSCKTDLPLTGSVLKSDADAPVDERLKEVHTLPLRSSNLPAGCASYVDDNYIVKREKEGHIAREGVPDMPSGNNMGTNGIFYASERHIENCTSSEGDMNRSIFAPETRLHADVSTRGKETEFIEMTFRMKPPAGNCTNWNSGDAVQAPFLRHCDFLVDLDNSDEKRASEDNLLCFRERKLDDCAPFFAKNCQEDKESLHEIHRNREIPNTEYAFGVPTHCQNDGSFLYLLTPAFSPPSLDSVCQWLLQLEYHNTVDVSTGASRENPHEVLMEPSSPKYDGGLRVINEENNCSNQGSSPSEVQEMCRVSYNDLINPQGSPAMASYRTPESNSLSKAHTVVDQLNQQNQGITGMEIKECHNYMIPIKPKGKGNNQTGQGCTNNWQEFSQISGPDMKSKLTPLSQIGFRDPASVGAGQQLTLLSVEVLTESRADLHPDPRFDAINIIALAIQEDISRSPEVYVLMRVNNKESCQRNLDGVSGCKVISTSEEKLLFDHFVKIIHSTDPDILMGWEIQGASLGFLAERAAHLGIGLLKTISRTPAVHTKVASGDLDDHGIGIGGGLLPEAIVEDPVALEDSIIEDEWGRTHASGVHVGGRIVLNIWRIMRSEIKLNMYTIEAVAEAVLRRKFPSIPYKTLTNWFSSGPGHAQFRCIEHSTERAKLNLEIMSQLDMINRTSELARVFGIDFFSVLSRGSQYRVESMFLRLAHTQNYLAISPGSQQVASQPAMECLPLVMEPESGFYADPVVVLDFQSLYPSMIIAYNLCFCTCLGNVRLSKANTLGVSSYSPDPQNLMNLKDQILLTPNGVMYVPPKIRKGVLPRLLEEILSTRIMVKKAMKKLAPSQQVLHRIFNARQLALKLIANVTYGYTAAGFSGRMPCAELADSIVQCGRRTLETAICFVNSHENWNARVIYGDTDSMFVLLKGRTVEQAFQIGQEIASAVTAMNPNPVTLKMEKVYHPCVLLTKKRYVGYSYENPDQIKPTFDAKGIETVRRDTCAAVAKTLEQSLRILFEFQDISSIKEYLHRQWTRILSGKASLQDFVFAKEVRLGTYRSSSLPPAALVAVKAMRADPRAEPRYGERIAYVVIHGEPGARLIDMVVDPLELLDINSPYRLNDLYYINKQIIPALQRVFGLLGADLNQWFSEMPRPVRPTLAKRHLHASESTYQFDEENKLAVWRKAPANRTRIDSYYLSRHCTLCGELVRGSKYLCDKCLRKGPVVAAALTGRTSKLEKEIQHLCAICRHCGGGDWLVESGVKCTSLACSVFYERRKVQKELRSLSAVSTEAGFYPRCMVEWF